MIKYSDKVGVFYYMGIAKEKVQYVANLARISLTSRELDNFTTQLDKILIYIEKLNKLNTEDTPITSHILGLKNIVREDEKKPSLPNNKALQNAPEKENGYFKVPKII